MPSDPINTAPIQNFINQVKAADLSNQREIKIDTKTAKSLAFCLTQLLAKNVQDYENLFKNLEKTEDVITVKMDGGAL